MKKFSLSPFILIAILLSIFDNVFADDLSFDRTSLGHGYMGSIYFKNKLIIYNTNGLIMYSEDKGDSWKQKDIVDKYYWIKNILQCDSVLVGILDSDYFIKSSDGLNWEKIPVESDEQFCTFDYCNGKYYVLGLYSISVYNSSFELDTLIRVTDQFVLEDIVANHDKFLITRAYHQVTHYDAKTYAALDTITVSPTQYAMGLYNLKRLGDTLFLTYENRLSRSTDFGYTWDSIAYPITHYQIHNNTIYRVIDTDDKKYNGLTTFTFEKLSPQTGWDTLSVTKYDRMALNLLYYTNDIIFIDLENILICGPNKHISKSSDGGKSWELKCLFNSTGKSRWFDEKRAVCTPGKAVFYHTSDGGVIWLPNKITPSYTKYFEEDSFGNSYTSYLDIKPNGEVFACYPNNDLEYVFEDNFVCKFISKDYGNSFEALLDTNITFKTLSLSHYSVEWNDNTTIGFQKFDKGGFYFVNLNSDYNCFWKNSKLEKNLHGIGYYNDKFHIVTSEEQTIISGADTSKFLVYSLMQSADTCKTWQSISELNRVELKNNFLYPYAAVNFEDKIIRVTSQRFIKEKSDSLKLVEWKLLEFNPNTGEKLNDCIIDTSAYFTSSPYIKYKNYNIYFRNGDPIYNDTTSSICDWKTLNGFGFFNLHSIVGDIIYGNGSSVLLKLTPKGYVSVNNTEQTEAKDYMYILNPYPIPGKNIITTPVYCDLTVAANPLKAEVYNMNGELVSLPNSITITRQNNNVALVGWNCQSVPAGVYLMQIIYGNNSHTIRCVVEGK